MKRLLSFFAVIIVSMIAMSCGKFSDGTSVWQQGLWIVPTLTGGGALTFWILTFVEWLKGGTVGWVQKGHEWHWTEDDKKFPIYRASFFWFAVGCTIATIIIFIMVNADK
jgi:hypothetical protein